MFFHGRDFWSNLIFITKVRAYLNASIESNGKLQGIASSGRKCFTYFVKKKFSMLAPVAVGRVTTSGPGNNLMELFTPVIFNVHNKPECLHPGKYFQSTLMFLSMARSLP